MVLSTKYKIISKYGRHILLWYICRPISICRPDPMDPKIHSSSLLVLLLFLDPLTLVLREANTEHTLLLCIMYDVFYANKKGETAHNSTTTDRQQTTDPGSFIM